LQFSRHQQVHEAALEFLEEYFDCQDQDEIIDDLNDLGDASDPSGPTEASNSYKNDPSTSNVSNPFQI